jgi:trigger factor
VVKVETEMLEDHQARLVVTVEPERLEQEMIAAAGRIAKQLNIPGFRKGRAPHHIVRRYVGDKALLEEALDPLGQAIYTEALEQGNLEPYLPGSLTDLSVDPLVMTFLVPLMPVVDLGDYRSLRVPFEAPEVTEQDVEAALKNLRDEQAMLEPVERAVAIGDVAMLDITGGVPGEDGGASAEIIDRESVKVLVADESTYPVPGFPQKIVGMQKEETREFSIDVADVEEYDEEVRGKTLSFRVVCREVYQRELPELNDEFAQSLGDYDSLNDLRTKLRSQLEGVALNSAQDLFTDRIFAELEPQASVRYPAQMLDEQIDSLIEDFDKRLREQGLTVEEYLKLNDLTRDQLREEFREPAKRSLLRALMLSQLIEEEALSVSDEEIDDEIETMILSFGSQAAIARQLFSSSLARQSIARRRLVEKAGERLMAIARGEAPDPARVDAGTKPDGAIKNEAGDTADTA